MRPPGVDLGRPTWEAADSGRTDVTAKRPGEGLNSASEAHMFDPESTSTYPFRDDVSEKASRLICAWLIGVCIGTFAAIAACLVTLVCCLIA